MITALLAIALSVTAAAPWTNTGPLTVIESDAGIINPTAHGVWRSRGFGWVLNITESGVTRLQEDDSLHAIARLLDTRHTSVASWR